MCQVMGGTDSANSIGAVQYVDVQTPAYYSVIMTSFAIANTHLSA